MEVARALLGLEHYAQSIFFCQQALEMFLKAMWIEQAEQGLPRRTHDLVALAAELVLDLSEEQAEFLRRLSDQYTPTRYPDMSVEYLERDAVEYAEKTKEFFAWLRQRLS